MISFRFTRSAVLFILLCATPVYTAFPQKNDKVIPVLKITDQPMHSGTINPMIYGAFIELLDDLVPGMWAEMLNDRNFEGVARASNWVYYMGIPNFCDREWNASPNWVYDKAEPFNGTQSARLTVSKNGNAGLSQSGLAVRKGMNYHFETYLKADKPGLKVKVILLEPQPDGSNRILGSARLVEPTTQWAKQQCEISSSGVSDRALFILLVTGSGNLWVDKISLMPEDNQKGWRTDVVEFVKASHPSAVRWGGSIIDPGGYKWKEGIGSRDFRSPFKNWYWGRIDPNDVGIDEFLQFCELIDAKPLICISFMDGVESARDLIHYCNDPAETEWGHKRAENGHPEPYQVQMWQVGNELIDEKYIQGSTAFCRAIRELDPEALILSSAPTAGLLAVSGQYLDILCPHHYSPELYWHEANLNEVARLIRNARLDHEVKIGITEWNNTAGSWGIDRGRLMTLSTGLYTAQYLNLLHRYSDVVELACRSNLTNSYCSGMVQTNTSQVYGTAAYHVMKLYAEHTQPVPLRIGTVPEGLDISASASEDLSSVCLFIVNTTNKPITINLDMSALGSDFKPVGGQVVGDTQDRRQAELMNHFTVPDRIRAMDLKVSGNEVTLPALSVSAINCK